MRNTTINPPKKLRKVVTILGVKIDSTPKDELLRLISQKLAKKIQFYIVTPNPEIILQAQNNPSLIHSLNSATFSIPDGVGLKLGNLNLKVIKGREFMLDLFSLANPQKLKVYFISKPNVIDKTLAKIKKDYPHITARGKAGPLLDSNAHPVSYADTILQSDIVKDINSFKPDLLFVAFGAPKQEVWIHTWLPKLKVTGAMGVGGALDYYSNYVRPVPLWLERLNLEWLWRFIQEPKRLGRILHALINWPLTLLLKSAKN